MPLSIDIISDVVCPWCYVGKRRLERALDTLALREATTIAWLPFELNPDMPPEGMARGAYRERKFGTARSAELDARMTETGREEGIAFAFDRMERTPSTRRAHVLIAHAGPLGAADRLVEGLFRAYFEEARDLGDDAVLLEVAAAAGLDPESARAALADPSLVSRVAALEGEATRAGIGGVPFFIVDGSWTASGAQPTEWWIAQLGSRAAAAAA